VTRVTVRLREKCILVGPRRVSPHRGPVAGAPCGLGAWGHAPTTTLEEHGRAVVRRCSSMCKSKVPRRIRICHNRGSLWLASCKIHKKLISPDDPTALLIANRHFDAHSVTRETCRVRQRQGGQLDRDASLIRSRSPITVAACHRPPRGGTMPRPRRTSRRSRSPRPPRSACHVPVTRLDPRAVHRLDVPTCPT
jgi:hypothetical protein